MTTSFQQRMRAFGTRACLVSAGETVTYDAFCERIDAWRGELDQWGVQRGDTVALDQPLFAGAAVEPGTLSQRAMDAALEFGTGLVRKAFDRAGKGGDKGGDKGAGADKGAAGAANPS